MKTEKIQEVIDIIKTLPVADSANSNENVVSTIEDDLFGESLDLSSNMEDNYIWSVYGQCWLPK